MVLEVTNGAVGNTHDGQARHRRLTLGPRLRRGPGGARRSPSKGPVDRSTAPSTTRIGSRQLETRGRKITTDGDVSAQTSPGSPSRRPQQLHPRICQTRRRPSIPCFAIHGSIPRRQPKQFEFQDCSTWSTKRDGRHRADQTGILGHRRRRRGGSSIATSSGQAPTPAETFKRR